ncbi:Mitochondrial distribution and morphology protein 12 [Spiromyces aspiralis]|uniref:Mitochondrial distribution and morphology protein 12 n=1 Tax=Spiromyces aspiralis TaxID=68401 RepID=A0ACC1HMA2_9FUNG|nr:Mitochondrial distribution and morphology protein 12 [Spiromyces aspiralis]
MSFQIYWEKLDRKVSRDVQAKLNEFFAGLPQHPGIAGEIVVKELDFGAIPPHIELVDITEPFPEFYLPTEDSEDEGEWHLRPPQYEELGRDYSGPSHLPPRSANDLGARDRHQQYSHSLYSARSVPGEDILWWQPGREVSNQHLQQQAGSYSIGLREGLSLGAGLDMVEVGRRPAKTANHTSGDGGGGGGGDDEYDLGVDDTSEDGCRTDIFPPNRDDTRPWHLRSVSSQSSALMDGFSGYGRGSGSSTVGYGGSLTPSMRFFGQYNHPSFWASRARPLQRQQQQQQQHQQQHLYHHLHPPLSLGQPSRSRYLERTQEDIQFKFKLQYAGDMTITLATKLQLNYPADSFMTLPVTLKITKLRINAIAIVAHLKNRINLCFLEPESPGMSILENLSIQSIIGDDHVHVLKNVEKVESFIIDQLRQAINQDFVFPSYSSIELTEDNNQPSRPGTPLSPTYPAFVD